MNRALRLSRVAGTWLALGMAAQGCAPEVDIGRWASKDAAASDASEEERDVDADCPESARDASACTVQSQPFTLQELTVQPGLFTSYFADGRPLPAGDYVITYVDGCWKSGVVAWTVNLGDEGYAVVGGANKQRLAMAPGTVGTFAGGLGAYFTYDECIAANQEQPSVAFHFDGGALGLQMDSLDPLTLFLLVAGGETVGGRSPTFLLRCDGVCQ